MAIIFAQRTCQSFKPPIEANSFKNTQGKTKDRSSSIWDFPKIGDRRSKRIRKKLKVNQNEKYETETFCSQISSFIGKYPSIPTFFKILVLNDIKNQLLEPVVQNNYFLVKQQKRIVLAIPYDKRKAENNSSDQELCEKYIQTCKYSLVIPLQVQALVIYMMNRESKKGLSRLSKKFSAFFRENKKIKLNQMMKLGVIVEQINGCWYFINNSKTFEEIKLLQEIFFPENQPPDPFDENQLFHQVKSLNINLTQLYNLQECYETLQEKQRIDKEKDQFLGVLFKGAKIAFAFDARLDNYLIATFQKEAEQMNFLNYLHKQGQNRQKWKKLITPEVQEFTSFKISFDMFMSIFPNLSMILKKISNQQQPFQKPLSIMPSNQNSLLLSNQEEYLGVEEAVQALQKANLDHFNTLWKSLSLQLYSHFVRKENEPYLINASLQLFTKLLEFKIKRYTYPHISLFQKLFPNTTRICSYLKRQVKLKRNQKYPFQGHLCDLGFSNDQKMIQHISQYKEKTLQISNIKEDNCLDFILDFYYAQSFRTIEVKKRIQVLLSSENYRFQLQKVKEFAYSKNSTVKRALSILYHGGQAAVKIKKDKPKHLLNFKLTNYKCLGCSQFFYSKMNIMENIHQPPLKIFNHIKSMREYQRQIKNDLCSMLNSGGGIIMFSCAKNKDLTQVFGQKMSEKQKQQYEQRFMSYVDAFQPKAEAKRSVTISFVPIKSAPSSPHESPVFQEATFVMRARVDSVNPSTTFYYKQSNDNMIEQKFQNYTISFMERGIVRQVKAKYLAKEIKKKMRHFYISSYQNKKMQLLSLRSHSVFDHDCLQPEAGICKSNVESIRMDLKKEDEFYPTAAMILVRKQNHETVVKSFKKLNIFVKIQQKYQDYYFKPASHTAILYSKEKFQIIIKAIQEHQDLFTFSKKQLLAINITLYLKYNSKQGTPKFDDSLFLSLRREIKKKMPNEKIKAFIFQPRNVKNLEYFLKFGSPQASLFGYYYMNHHMNDRLIFKNPLHLDKMDELERKERIKEICPEQDSSMTSPIYCL